MPVDERNLRGVNLNENRIFDGLTPSQWKYCEARSNGASQLEAYKDAYPNQRMSARDMSRTAHDFEVDPRIVAKTKQMIAEKRPQTPLVPTITREFVTAGIVEIATSEKSKDTTRLRAYELLGKIAGVDLFREIRITETRNRSVDEVDAELREYLARLKPILEGTARAVNGETPSESPDINLNPVNSEALTSTAASTAAQSGGALALGAEPKRERRRKPMGG